jgi:hypothetical protein
MQLLASGFLRKMRTQLGDDGMARYEWLCADTNQDKTDEGESAHAEQNIQSLELEPLLGKQIELRYHGKIECIYCARPSSKSFAQGYCYPCFRKLARCDLCVLRPHTCHYDEGTCREPEWGMKHCMQGHTVYLAETSSLKVGLTRDENIPGRWIDQGALSALPIFKASRRKEAGMVEHFCSTHAGIKETTQWRAMLGQIKGSINLLDARAELLERSADAIHRLGESSEGMITPIEEGVALEIRYPMLRRPEKISSANLDKEASISGCLQGIKAQYLIIDDKVLNIRKFSGYAVDLLSE